MEKIGFQDQYLDARSDCWGCGRNNSDGLHVKSHWDGDEAVAYYQPQDHQTGHKGVVNGGILATLVDCHSIGLAMAHAHRLEGRKIGSEPLISYVTASLHIDYLKPTPLNGQGLELRAQIKKVDGRKTYIKCSVFANNIETAQGEVLGIRISEAPIKL